jgi:purine-cytosine permease-like protein
MAAADQDGDFATVPVPPEKRISWKMVFSAELGIATALLYMQITSELAVRFGVATALIGIAYGTLLSGVIGMAVARLAIRSGLGCNLLARYVLGQKGAVLFSLIYGGNAFVYFAFEATIMGESVRTLIPGIDMRLLLPALAIAMIPLVWFGMKLLAKFQTLTFILYALLLIVAVGRSLVLSSAPLPEASGLSIGGVLQALAVMNSVVFITAFVSADFVRFTRLEEERAGVAIAGVGFQMFCFLFSGLLGLWLATRTAEGNPGRYFVTLLGFWGVIFAFATQLRINLSNMYAGSLAVTNILVEGLFIPANRQLVTVLFGGAIALTLFFNLFSDMTTALTVIGMFTTCFTCLTLVHCYMLHPGETETVPITALTSFRWPAIAALVCATLIGSLMQFGAFGPSGLLIAGPVAVLLQTFIFIAASHMSSERKQLTLVKP